MNISGIKVGICTFFGMLGGVIVDLFGGWSENIATLIIFMVVDYAMGIVVAGVFKNSNKSKTGRLDSRIGWTGLCKKCMTFLFVILARRLDILLGTSYILTATVIGFITNEAISIIENAGLMGMPLPNAVTKAIEVLREENENGNNF